MHILNHFQLRILFDLQVGRHEKLVSILVWVDIQSNFLIVDLILTGIEIELSILETFTNWEI